MSKIGIVALEVTPSRKYITISRAVFGSVDTIETNNWEEAVAFLTEKQSAGIHICWQLAYLVDCLLDLMPTRMRKELENKSKVFYGGAKIFSVKQLLGITNRRLIKGNFYSEEEVNIYGIRKWLADGADMPDLLELEQIGYEILDGLAELGVYTDKLTSPIGVWADKLEPDNLPTIYNLNESFMDAVDYADVMTKHEWHKKYSQAIKNTYYYDLTSAYPFFISSLPDTSQMIGKYSTQWLKCDWGIVKGRFTPSLKILPVEAKVGYYTTEEIKWLGKHQAGQFELVDGWYFNFKNDKKPYQAIVANLIKARQSDNAMVSLLARRIAQGLSGKLDQYNRDGSWGEIYNPLLSAMVRSRCRLAVADLIYENDLLDSLVSISVDGVRATKELDIPAVSKAGEWRKIKG